MTEEFKEQLRAEICKSLMEGKFTPKTCTTVMKLAESAREILRATATKPEDLMDGTSHFGDLEVPLGAETFGTKALREMLPLVQQKLNPPPKPQSLEELLRAYSLAKEAGLVDISARIREKIDAQTKLESVPAELPSPTTAALPVPVSNPLITLPLVPYGVNGVGP